MKKKNRKNKADRNRLRRVEENENKILDYKVRFNRKIEIKKFRKDILLKMGESKERIKQLLDY